MSPVNHVKSDEERIAQARQEVREHPDDPEAFRRLAGMLYLSGKIEEAIPHLEKAVKLSDGAVDYELALADVLFDALLPRDAARLYERLLSKTEDPRHSRVQMNLGLARSETAFFDAVNEPLSKLPADNPEKALLEGTLALLQGRNGEAMGLFEKALSSPATARAAQENVAFLWSVGRELPPEGESRLVTHLLEARKGGEPSARFLLYLADAYAGSRLHEKANELLISALKKDPKYLPAYDRAGAFLRQLNIHGEPVAEHFRKAVARIMEGLPERIAVPARRRFTGGKPDNGDGDTNRAVKGLLGASDPGERLLGLLEAAELFTPQDALALLGDEAPVEDPVALLILARLRLRAAGLDKAVETVLRALIIYPASAEVAYAAAYFLGLRRRFVTAYRMIEAAGGSDELSPELLLEIGLVHVEAGAFDEAMALAGDRQEPEAVVVRARALMRSGDEEQALEDLERAFEETGSDIVKRELSALYFRQGRDEDAIKLLSK